MGLIQKMRRQDAVLFVRGAPDGMGGYAFAAPVQIKCRWEDTSELFINPTGQQETSRAKVYVDRDVAVGDYLWLGTVAQLPGSYGVEHLHGCFRVRSFSKLPNMKASEFLRTAYV